MADRPLSDWEKEQLRKYMREDKLFTRPALWTILIGAGVAYGVTCWLTQPWPRKGAGGGYGTNIAGPGITILATLATVLILGKLLRRRTPLHAPRLGTDDPPPSAVAPPWQP